MEKRSAHSKIDGLSAWMIILGIPTIVLFPAVFSGKLFGTEALCSSTWMLIWQFSFDAVIVTALLLRWRQIGRRKIASENKMEGKII